MMSQEDFTQLLKTIEAEKEKLRLDRKQKWVRFLKNEMSQDEKQLYQSTRRREYIDFTATDFGQSGLYFLQNYLASSELVQERFKDDLLTIFNSVQLAVLAVRLKSERLISCALSSMEKSFDLSNDIRDNIVSLTLVYNCAKILGLNGDKILLNLRAASSNKSFRNFLKEFMSREDNIKTLKSMRYEAVNDPEFGFIEAVN